MDKYLERSTPRDARCVVGTDPGIDDIIALGLLSKLSPDIEHVLLPSFGNVSIDAVAKNTREFIEFCAPHWEIGPPCMVPLSGTIERPFPEYFHGPDGLWNVHLDADTHSRPTNGDSQIGEGDLDDITRAISLASLTPFAQRNETFPGASMLNEITVMGGVFFEPGNETDVAEANMAYDPTAADVFFARPPKQTSVVPLDVTRQVTWSIEEIHAIEGDDTLSQWIKSILIAWDENYDHETEIEICLHDPLAVWLTFFPDYAKWESHGVRVALDDEQRGQTIFDVDRPPCDIALGLLDPKDVSEQIWKTLFT